MSCRARSWSGFSRSCSTLHSTASSRGRGAGATRDSEALQHPARVLDHGRPGEAMADQLAPFLEVVRAAEIHGVVLDRLPLHDQPIAARLLDRAVELEAVAALGTLEERRRLGDIGLELGLEAGLHLDLGDLVDHQEAAFAGCFQSAKLRPSAASVASSFAGLSDGSLKRCAMS